LFCSSDLENAQDWGMGRTLHFVQWKMRLLSSNLKNSVICTIKFVDLANRVLFLEKSVRFTMKSHGSRVIKINNGRSMKCIVIGRNGRTSSQ
jgi:hypothetical protein